jgi:hypothetical protein
MLGNLPSVAVTSLIAFDVIHVAIGLALGLAAALLLLRSRRIGNGWGRAGGERDARLTLDHAPELEVSAG